MKIILGDTNQDLYDFWKKDFDGIENVEVFHGNVFDLDFDAMVSPANSFGFMDGGIDLAISENFGWDIQNTLQTKLRTNRMGELLIGQAEIIETSHQKCKWIISAPTMRVPSRIIGTLNVYLASKAIFQIAKHNTNIQTLLIPGLGTGTGGILPHICSKQMRQAYEDIFVGFNFPVTWRDVNHFEIL
jgi:O-acetyl-ADP-ribose deacetylase (regulator of RNase III)